MTSIQRDITALRDMGVPLWTRPGPGGGIGIVDGWISPITGMTGPELQSLTVGETASRDLGLQEQFETARLKMLTTTSAQATAVEPAQQRFLIDNERWFSHPEPSQQLSAVAQAVWSARRVTLHYQRPGGQTPVRRLLDPLGLVLKTDRWYLVAAHRRSLRTYRLSRVTATVVHDDDAYRPENFSRAECWSRSRAEFEAAVHTLPVHLSIPVESSDALRSAVPGAAAQAALQSARQTEDRLDLELNMERMDIALAQLLAVPGVEVTQPPDLRNALRERGEDLLAHNSPQSSPRATPESAGPAR